MSFESFSSEIMEKEGGEPTLSRSEAGRPPNGQGEKRPRIGFASAYDPRDLRAWSGTLYFMLQALQKHCGEVRILGPFCTLDRKPFGALGLASRVLCKKYYLYTHTHWLAKRYATLLKERISRTPVDLLFAPAAAPEIAFLKTSVPIVYTADSTFALLRDYYPTFSRVWRFSAREANEVDRRAIQNASLLVYPSHWAAQSAVRDYHGDESRIHVVPYGANLEDTPAPESVFGERRPDVCRLLLVGVDWERKGGDVAVETLTSLRAQGIPAELTICGCEPPRKLRDTPGLRVIPFLSKKDPAERKRLIELYLTSHFFLLPSRYECYGIGFCEANAFGLPVVATRTGGIPEIIREGENGFMLPLSARGPEFAGLIAGLWQDQDRYSHLVGSSRKAFDERLNWDAWGIALQRLLPQAVRSGQTGSLSGAFKLSRGSSGISKSGVSSALDVY